ncbi:MAG: dipeptide epimerase [Alphaproteobacteria bacterium]|nr:dipeptide epimerase [Alphaproteobacteria bacterium]
MPAPTRTEIEITGIRIETWPLLRPFVISRGAKTEARVVVVEVRARGTTGRGESVPYARYGETPEAACELLRRHWPLDCQALQNVMPHGAARNALDCALWDLEAKVLDQPAYALAGLPAPKRAQTCFTISLGTPGDMARQASEAGNLRLLKLKLGGDGDDERMRAVRAARPDCRLVADANEAWSENDTPRLLAIAAEQRFEMIEQPLPANADAALASLPRPLPVCADESAHTSADLKYLANRYDAVNIKLDKAGGLTEALKMTNEARQMGFKVMVGSMVATSLGAAPAMLLAGSADWLDLDGPMLLSRDRADALQIVDGWIEPPLRALWG